MKVTLKEITKETGGVRCRLQVAEDQKDYVASNVYSLAEAAYERGLSPLGVYNSWGTMVGFAMYGFDAEHDQWWIVRTDDRSEVPGPGVRQGSHARVAQCPKVKARYLLGQQKL